MRRGSYPSPEVQSVYSTILANRAVIIFNHEQDHRKDVTLRYTNSLRFFDLRVYCLEGQIFQEVFDEDGVSALSVKVFVYAIWS